MEELGQKITYYRKDANLTQKDLGDKLNVSPQAVSKWENGQAEPDASTIKKLCEIFKISTDELLGNVPPTSETNRESAAETAVATAAATTAEEVTPQLTVERVVEQKIINGYCDMCKKPVGPGEYVVEGGSRGSTQHIYCNECNRNRIAFARQREYYAQKSANIRSIIWGAVAGVIALTLVLVAFLVGDPDFPKGAAVVIAIIAGVGYFAFIMQMFWDGAVNDLFSFFLKSFSMPGVIFTLDLDGLLFLLFVKVGGAILSVLLSVLLFLIGLIIMPFAGIMILPFASIFRIIQTKKLKAEAEKA